MTQLSFDITPQIGMKYSQPTPANLDARAKAYYDEKPARSPFSHQPMSFDVAKALGLASAVRAEKRVWAEDAAKDSGPTGPSSSNLSPEGAHE